MAQTIIYNQQSIIINPILTQQIQSVSMHHTTRNGKFHHKFDSKAKDKSILPEIDTSHATTTKYGDIFGAKAKIGKDLRKLTKDRAQGEALATRQNFKGKDPNPYVNVHKILSEEQNEPNILNPVHTKKTSIQPQKQLMTADTIRSQPKHQTISYHLKQTPIQGLDMWTLNNNLKQFSQTRKLPFYKARQDNRDTKERTAEPMMSKTKTQEIRSMYKIYGGGQVKPVHSERDHSEGQLHSKKLSDPIKKVKLPQKETKSHTTINPKLVSPLGNTLYGTLPVRKHHSNLENTYYKRQDSQNGPILERNDHTTKEVNPYLRTFINGSHLRREGSNRNIHILEMGSFGAKEVKGGNVRRNRFELVERQRGKQQVEAQDQDHFLDKYPSKSLNCPQPTTNHRQQSPSSSISSQPSFPQPLTTSLPSTLPKSSQPQKKNYEYLRSIQRINKSLLKSSNNYIEQYHTFSHLPNSKIQFYVDSLNHPEVCGSTVQYKSMFRGEVLEEEFWFGDGGKQLTDNRDKGKKAQSLAKGKKQLSKNKILN